MYHGYENGFRTLGRQVLLEPAESTEDGWLRATGGDLSAAIRKPAFSPGSLHRCRGRTHWPARTRAAVGVYSPARDEATRIRFDSGALCLDGKGTDPSDASPLTVPAGDRAYEIEVTLSAIEPGAQGGLLLFFNRALFLGMGWDGATMTDLERRPPQPLP